ncbi:MAG: 50S ribosomal protein L18 [Candidatus Pacebacteria bacterium]|nr:50S ribosomal protein L18 [Candidatus Paceibacterota bacterium]
MNKNSKKEQREKRHRRVRAKIYGTKDRPRLCIFKSNKHIYVQIINDDKGFTLVFASDLEIKDSKKDKRINLAQKVGELIANKAKDKKITKILFDRGGFKYHGRVKTLADEARKHGLQF